MRFLLFLMAIWTSTAVESLWAAEPYKVTNEGSLFQVTSPYGPKMLFGEMAIGNMRNYRFEVPLSELRASASNDGAGGAGSGSGGGASGSSGTGNSGQSPQLTDEEDQLVLKSNELYNKGQFTDALKFVDELLRRNRDHVRGWVMKGSLMHMLGQKDLAKKAWQRAVELEPNNAQLKQILKEAP
jgi:tetratricopeptide (TPR) repeat protein